MKLQKLIIRNIASIQDATIDFEAQPLADSEVFLITGKTGAGKSTVLDAICLALFAKTPRLEHTEMQGKIQDNKKTEVVVDDPRQLMRRNTGEASAVLSFTGNNGTHYQATWSVIRAHRKTDGTLQSKEWKLTNLDTSVSLSKDKEIEAEMRLAVGLNFDQFCRTTMLAQGEFTRFLNSKDEEKADILEKITGTDIYTRIGAKIYEVTKGKEQEKDLAKEKVENVVTLRDEQVEGKKQELEQLKTSVTQIQNEEIKFTGKRTWITTSALLTNDIKNAEGALMQAKQAVESEDFKQKELLTSQWQATIDVRQHMRNVQEAEKSVFNNTTILKTAEQQYPRILNSTSQTSMTQHQVREILDEKQQLLNRRETELKAEENQIAALNLTGKRDEREKMNLRIQLINKASERMENLKKEEKRMADAQQELKKTEEELKKKKQLSTELEEPVQKANEYLAACKNKLDKQRDTVDKFASTMRQKLQIGQECPVCGRLIEQALPREEDLQQLWQEAQSEYDKAEKTYNELMEKRQTLDNEITVKTKWYNDQNQKLQQDDSVKKAQELLYSSAEDLGMPALSSSDLDALAQQKQELTNLISVLSQQIKDGDDRDKAAKANRQSWERDRTALMELNRQIAELDQRIATILANLQTAEQQIRDNRPPVDQFLTEHPEYTTERLTELNQYDLETISRLNHSISRVRDAVTAANTTLTNAQNKLAEHQKNQPELKEEDTESTLTVFIDGLKNQISQLNQQMGAIHNELKADQEAKTIQGTLINEAQKKKDEYERWSRLNELLGDAKGNKFRKIAQSYVLNSLIHSANEYMQTLTNRYTLKVKPGSFVILIEDAWQGFQSRAASTISGGESFLVSLSLALALSDIGQRLSVDTLFIDEGFGTLSGEPLQNAINTLKLLHKKAGRHVGIISHVEELKRDIPVQIQVNQEGNNSLSTITVVPN